MRCLLLLLLIMLSIMAAACSSNAGATRRLPHPLEMGDPMAGKVLFSQGVVSDGVPACASCHTLDPDQTSIGPSLAGVASRAGTRVKGLDAEGYLRQSILDPGAYDAAPDSSVQMYANFAKVLSEEQLNDLVAYLLTLQ